MKNFYFVFIAFITGFNASAQVIESDSLALVDLYNKLDGLNWNRSTNWLNGPVGTWQDVVINNSRVIRLNLNANNLSGELPDAFYKLTGLVSFSFLNNNITGVLKEDIGNMTELTGLGFQGCKLSGSLPESISNLKKLSSLHFASNNLSGPLPDFLDQLPSLSVIFLQNNRFSGPIPDSWKNCKSLSTLILSGNEITGTLDNFAYMPRLRSFTSSGNDWDPQPFPQWIDTMAELFLFTCIDCNLVGEIPPMDLTDQDDFNTITLTNNHLTSGVQYLFGPQSTSGRIFSLNVGNNNFTGNFPSSKIKYVRRIDIRNNGFDAFDAFDYEELDQIIMFENSFTFESMLPHKEIFNSDSIIVNAANQDSLLGPSTIDKETGTSITIHAGDDADYNHYTWFKDGNNIIGANASTLILNNLTQHDAGVYTCRITNDTISHVFLYRSPITLTIDGVTKTKDITQEAAITLYPNPAKGFLHLTIDLDDSFELYLYSTQGKLLLQKSTVHHRETISTHALAPGYYFLKLKGEDINYVGQFIKSK